MQVCKQTKQRADKQVFSLVTNSPNGPNFSLYILIFREPRKLYLELCTWRLYCKNLFYSQHIYAKFRYPRKRGGSKESISPNIHSKQTYAVCMLLIGSIKCKKVFLVLCKAIVKIKNSI